MTVQSFEPPAGYSRRRFLSALAAGGAGLALASCTSLPRRDAGGVQQRPVNPPRFGVDTSFGGYAQMYAARVDEGYPLPGIPWEKIERRFLRQIVVDPTGERPGSVVVDTKNHFLYVVREGGEAIRYGVGLGRAGFEWSGRAIIQWKRKWPTWTPPDTMIARQPELAKWSAENGGMPPGLTNPLGARALYIFQDGVDTLYRLHGSPEWQSIGRSVSSGCVRLINQDVIDLYDRVPNKTPILVY